jgi:hypothetical protein
MRREPVIVNDCRVPGDTLHGLHFIRDGGFFTGKFMKAGYPLVKPEDLHWRPSNRRA